MSDISAAKAGADESVVTLQNERDRIAAELTETADARDAAISRLSEVEVERDKLAATLAELEAARLAAESARAARSSPLRRLWSN